ncbi:YncE family protein [Bacillus sp. SCS-151]|uniref:YncE family protein n=1 Tax=Nanhaiella sioensis TaxID=3115293 RepID=UPI00397CE983
MLIVFGTVSVIDIKTHSVIDIIQVGDRPQSVSFTPDGKLAYVANLGSATISVIDIKTHTVIDTIQVGDTPIKIAFTPN